MKDEALISLMLDGSNLEIKPHFLYFFFPLSIALFCTIENPGEKGMVDFRENRGRKIWDLRRLVGR